MIRETDWCVDRTEIVLEMQHLKGINKSFYLAKSDIMDLYDFTNTITKIVISIDEQLIELQRNLKRLNLNP
jgi:DNA-binding transcriptional regulator GbsR (MarR family)